MKMEFLKVINKINDPVTENHMITNAGNYTIYVSIHEARKNMCASLPIDVKATIEPRSLTDSVIHLDDIGITVYYTGMPIIPENWIEESQIQTGKMSREMTREFWTKTKISP